MINHTFIATVALCLLATLPMSSRSAHDLNFQPREVIVSDPTMGLRGIIDPEIDSVNNQFCWSDRQGYLWLGYIDPATGEFDPPNGRGKLIDTDTVTTGEIGNGPEWVFTNNGPQIAYTLREQEVIVLARAFMLNGQWETTILQDSLLRKGPIGSLDRGDQAPMISYQGPNPKPGAPFNAIYVRTLTNSGSEQMIPSTDTFRTPGARWIEGENAVVFTRPMPEGTPGPPRQVFKYDSSLQQLEQMTFDNGNKIAAFIWNAPEYGGEQVLLTLIGERLLGLYRYLDEDDDGTFNWTRVQIIDPPSTGDYIWSPEPFVYEGRTYISMVTSTSNDQQSLTIPSEIWLADIDPEDPLYRKLSDEREVNRKDPEVYMSDQGPFVYASVAEQVDGPDIYRFDTGLGPQADVCRSGACNSGFSGWRVILLEK